MATAKVTIQVEIDGQELPGFPLTRTLTLAEGIDLNNVTKAANNDATTFAQLPGSVMAIAQLLVLTADEAFNLKFNNASYLPMSTNGIVVLVGANIAAGAATNVTVNNPAAATAANLQGYVGGT